MLLILWSYQKKKIKFWNLPSSRIYVQSTITLPVAELGVCVFEMTKHGRQIKYCQHGMCFPWLYGMRFIFLILLCILIIYLKLLTVNFLIMHSRAELLGSRNISQNRTKLVSLFCHKVRCLYFRNDQTWTTNQMLSAWNVFSMTLWYVFYLFNLIIFFNYLSKIINY